jgi:5'-3' exonuclease
MGIFNFWNWFKTNFSGSVQKLGPHKKFQDVDVVIDNLMIDMNGLFHTSAQKIYKYGNFKPKDSNIVVCQNNRNDIKVFEDICKNIDELFNVVKPNKRMILAVDGVAPYAKNIQMRKRRFKNAVERKEDEDKLFDSNCISPGTRFMDNLGRYIDWFLRKKISEDVKWRDIEIVFSNEKYPSEGEQKIISYLRKNGNNSESYCIHGLDADIIMLSLGTHLKNLYVLRDDLYDPTNKYFIINIGNTTLQLVEMLRWESKNYTFDEENCINDFIFMGFMAGNDFLPHIPSIEILEGGIDIMIDIYKNVCINTGHFTKSNTTEFTFSKTALKMFFDEISQLEKPILEKKLLTKGYFTDETLLNCANFDKNTVDLDIEKYREQYCEKYFGKGKRHLKNITHHYLDGLQWVMTYYKKGCPNWLWFYNYNYVLPTSIMTKHILSFIPSKHNRTQPLLPFQQLLAVLPPKSSQLLPKPLNTLLTNNDSVIKEYYPDVFEVDLSGKKREYQGIVLLPMIQPEILVDAYQTQNSFIEERELKRNIFGKTFLYSYDLNTNSNFISYYGNINNCKTKIRPVYVM